jgi:hypothetical protein
MYQICLFEIGTVRVSDDLSVHHQEFKTVHTTTGICQTDTTVCMLQASVKQILLSACYRHLSNRYYCLLATGICQTGTAVCLLQAFVKQILLAAAAASSSVGPMVNATDVLQPKRLIVLILFSPRVWTLPRSPTDAPTSPPPHDARDPGSERWNYVGEN